ncbi:MAG: hypothetical protein HY579_01270 [Nitrospinae bacterium]|nr:hypothetical protein [Nitrospinota bacterium]
MNPQDILFHNKLLQLLLDVDRIGFRENLAEILQTYFPFEALERFIAPIIQEIGNGLSQGKFSLSQVYMGGRLCEEAIPPLLAEQGVPPKNHVPLAIAVLQDRHILGKKIVFHALRSSGYH